MDIAHWIVNNFVSPIMLIVFVIVTLCMIADARPEPIVNGLFGILRAIVEGVFKLLWFALGRIFGGGSRNYPGKGGKTS